MEEKEKTSETKPAPTGVGVEPLVKPILFSGAMVRAILEGRKTQTRRVIKPQPLLFLGAKTDNLLKQCPYGSPGDGLWVRETFRFDTNEKEATITFRADGTIHHVQVQDNAGLLSSGDFGKWKPSIFMPRWASRLTLTISEIRVERVQDISEEDALSEGITPSDIGITNKTCFRILWDSINDKRGFGWKGNPWVWVIVFKV